MTISYNWLCEYLSVTIAPDKLSTILTSLGLEVENFEKKEQVKGGLQGLLTGEVVECGKHPNADKLSLTKVNTGSGELLSIVCGAPNVAVGQKVIIAPVGATIYPLKGDPITMKLAKIRGQESYGMICAEDEIGLGDSHAGIIVLPSDTPVGLPASTYFQLTEDWIYEIGLTPNRMDAMSHLGVAKDVSAYLATHDNILNALKYPYTDTLTIDRQGRDIKVKIENTEACQRYCGVVIEDITVKESPPWLKKRLQSIGLRTINNIVDITNFILHETGQPLHAFDAAKIKGNEVMVKNLPAGTAFVTLDEKERKLNADDIMICNGAGEPMCFGGVFGGLDSGVTTATQHIFLESAWFNPITIRKTSFKHNLRTDAATRFEKGVDISNTANVLKRAALLIRELAGGKISSPIIDVYPAPQPKKQVTLTYEYLKKLSGKSYTSHTVKNILVSLGFEITSETETSIVVSAPYSKPDIELPADLVEEIMRVDGYDNVEIPLHITISPSVETIGFQTALKDKTSNYLAGNGFNEIFTNSITNSAYFDDEVLKTSVKMINSLSAELNIMRPSMLQTGLECVVHNLNRKNNNLRLFEFGKIYKHQGVGRYEEQEKLCLYVTGLTNETSWKNKENKSDVFYLKGIAESVLQIAGLDSFRYEPAQNSELQYGTDIFINKQSVATLGLVRNALTKSFDIKQPVWYISFDWEKLYTLAARQKQGYTEIPRFPAVQRDLAIVLDKQVTFETVELTIKKAGIKKLESMKLFDVFESEKLGVNKKSLAVSFTFLDREKTLTDSEIDSMIQNIIARFEKELAAEIRK